MVVLERTLLAGLILVPLAGPLPFGSVEPWPRTALTAGALALGTLWVVWRGRRGLAALPVREPLFVAGVALALTGLVQMVPLPAGAVAAVSPETARIRARYEPASPVAGRDPATTTPASGAAWRPLSLYPWATRDATLRLLALLVAALITLDLAARPGPRRLIAWALVAGGLFQAVYGLVEYLSGHQHIFLYAKRHYTDVVTGTFINRNHFAGFMELTLPLAIALAAETTGRGSRAGAPDRSAGERFASGPGIFRMAVRLVMALVMAVALVCSRSRMGIAGMILALVAVGIVLAWKGRGRGFAVASFVVLAATTVLFSQGGAGLPIVDRFEVVLRELSGAFGRWQLWKQAASMLAAFPALGVGLGAFPHVFPAFRTVGPGVAFAHAHNDVLEFAVETGIAGSLVAAAAAVGVARSWWRAALSGAGVDHLGRAALTGALALGFHSLADFNLAIPSNAFALALVIGLAGASLRAPGPVLVSEPHAGGRAAGGRGAALALAALAAAAIVDSRRSADAIFQSSAAIEEDLLGDLRALVQAEAGGTPSSPEAGRYIRQRLEETRGMVDAGLRRHPTSATGHLLRGRLTLAHCAAANLAGGPPQDCLGEALPDLRSALTLGPMSAATHARAASVLIPVWPALAPGDRREFAGFIERAIAMNSSDRGLRDAWVSVRQEGRP